MIVPQNNNSKTVDKIVYSYTVPNISLKASSATFQLFIIAERASRPFYNCLQKQASRYRTLNTESPDTPLQIRLLLLLLSDQLCCSTMKLINAFLLLALVSSASSRIGEQEEHHERFLQAEGEKIEGQYLVKCKSSVRGKACNGLANAFAVDGALVLFTYENAFNGFALEGVKENVS